MIKLLKLLELDFPTSAEEQPSAFEGENEAIQDYVDAVRLNEPKGTTIDKATEELKDVAPSTQLKALIALAKNGLLVIKSKSGEEYDDEEDTMDELPPIKISPKGVLKMFNVQSDVAYDALVNYNLNEDNPCWDGYKLGNPKTKISSKTGERVNNCVPVNETLNENEIDYYEDRYGNKFQTVDVNYLQYPGRVMVKYDNIDESVEYKGNFEADLKTGIIKRADREIDEAFFIGEDDIDPIDEYDVDETNLSEVKDFVKFMKKYTSFLAEAQCDCVYEALYKGRKVTLGKPMQGDIKKFKVYVKNNKGKVVKVNFGFGGKSAKGKRMVIKAKNPKRRSAYRKRHHCDNPGPRWKANYWSCRKW
jgi:hypothetical protein